MIREVETKEMVARFEDSVDLRNAVFEKVVAFFQKHETFHGEVIMQSDAPQLDAAPFLASMADELFRFKVEYKD